MNRSARHVHTFNSTLMHNTYVRGVHPARPITSGKWHRRTDPLDVGRPSSDPVYCRSIFVLIQDFAAAGVPDYAVGCCEAGGWARRLPEVPGQPPHRFFSSLRPSCVLSSARRYLRWAHRAQCNCAGAAPEQPLLRATASHPLLLCACRRETAARPVAGLLGRQRRRGWLVAASLCGPLRPALTA